MADNNIKIVKFSVKPVKAMFFRLKNKSIWNTFQEDQCTICPRLQALLQILRCRCFSPLEGKSISQNQAEGGATCKG